jgi:hypothetical protein
MQEHQLHLDEYELVIVTSVKKCYSECPDARTPTSISYVPYAFISYVRKRLRHVIAPILRRRINFFGAFEA